MPEQSTASKELCAIIENLPPMKTSALMKLTGRKYDKDVCRYALIRCGKLLLSEAERHKNIVAEIKSSPTPLTSAYIRKKYGVVSSVATNLLRASGKLVRVRLDSCYNIAKSLAEPMLARDFAQKYGKSLKQSRKALSRYGKLKPAVKGKPTSGDTDKPPRRSAPKPRPLTTKPKALLAPRLPAPKPKTTPDTRLIASIYQAWAERNL